jgi:hypothetical protein
MQSKFAPAEGVTPPAEVHACPTVHSAPCTTRYRCLPTGVTGSRSRPTPPGFQAKGVTLHFRYPKIESAKPHKRATAIILACRVLGHPQK